MSHAATHFSARVSSWQFNTVMARIKLHADWGRLLATAKAIDRAAKGELSNRGDPDSRPGQHSLLQDNKN